MCLVLFREKLIFFLLYILSKISPLLTDILTQQLAVTRTYILPAPKAPLRPKEYVTYFYMYYRLRLCNLKLYVCPTFLWLKCFITNCTLFLNTLKMCPLQQLLCGGWSKEEHEMLYEMESIKSPFPTLGNIRLWQRLAALLPQESLAQAFFFLQQMGDSSLATGHLVDFRAPSFSMPPPH